MAAHRLAKRWGQLTQEGEILSEGCDWGIGLQDCEKGGQGRAREWSGRRKGLAQGVMWLGQAKVSEGRYWVGTTDNDERRT